MIDEYAPNLVARAQRRMSEMALSLQKLFSPIDVAGLLIGAAVGILSVNFGRDKAAEYVGELAREMRESDDEPQHIKH
jgi:hypothetical protein